MHSRSSVLDPLVTELETKLRESLDECQTIKDIPDLLGADGYVDLQGLPEYQLDPGTKMLDEVRRHSIAEALETQRRAMTGEDPHARGDTQPFYDLRQTLMSIGNQWDQGAERIIVLDELRRSYIFLRVSLFDSLTPCGNPIIEDVTR